MKIEKVDKMETDIKEGLIKKHWMDIKEASEVIFPIFLKAVEDGEKSYVSDHKKIKKWAEITLEILNDIYPPDIFTGISGDKGPKAVILIRGILMEGLKKEA